MDLLRGVRAVYMKKIFNNIHTGKTWWIEMTDTGFMTCLNNGKVKETVCTSSFQSRSKAQSAMKAQMKKGFIYQNSEAKQFEPIFHMSVDVGNTGFMPIASNSLQTDFYIVGVKGQFEDECIYHIVSSGEICDQYSLGGDRLSYSAVLQNDGKIYLNNKHRVEQFDITSGKNTFLSDTLDGFKMILDGNGNSVLYYDGSNLVVSSEDKIIWEQPVHFAENNTYHFHYYCFGILSNDGTKVLYRCDSAGYFLVDVGAKTERFIENVDWGAFFYWNDEYVVIGDKCYSVADGTEQPAGILPFPLPLKQLYPHAGDVIFSDNLAAIKESSYETGSKIGIQIWDCDKKELLTTIKDDFIIKNFSMKFAGHNLVIYSDYGVVSVYNCSTQD